MSINICIFSIYAVNFAVKGNACMQLVKEPFCAHPKSCIQVAKWEKKSLFMTAPYGFVLFVVIQCSKIAISSDFFT